MNITAKVTRLGNEGVETTFYNIFVRDAECDEEIVSASFVVTDEGFVMVNQDGETRVIDDLADAERVNLRIGTTERVVWPKEAVKVI